MRVADIPLYELSDAARAAGVPPIRLADWVQRGNVTPAQPASGSGGRHRFSRNDVINIAIGQRLWKMGLDPSDAFAIAAAWMEDTRLREAGELFPRGTTLLVARDDYEARVINADQFGPESDSALLAINLNKVVAAVEPLLIERRTVPFRVLSTSLGDDERREAVDRFVASAA